MVVGPSGDITIVECKLASNDEARRKIIGQVLDYAARFWKMPYEEFNPPWTRRTGPPLHDWLEPSALEDLKTNLADGRFRLILAVDTISVDLRRLVEYVNAHTLPSVQVLAIELSVLHADNIDVLIPTVYGLELLESAGHSQATNAAPNWTVNDVADWFTTNQPDLSGAVDALLLRLQAASCICVGTSAQTPSLSFAVDTSTGRLWPFALYTSPRPTLTINFAYLAKAGENAQEQFLQAIEPALPPGIGQQIRAADYRKRPGFDLTIFLKPPNTEHLVNALQNLTT